MTSEGTVSVSWGSFWQHCVKSLEPEMGHKEASAVCAELFLQLAAMDPARRLMMAPEPMDHLAEKKIEKAIRACRSGMPVQYVTRRARFMDMNLNIRPGVLIPRPETEELVLWIHDTLKHDAAPEKLHMLDVGCGSGCISLGLARLFHGAKITACDIKPEALNLSRLNAREQGLSQLEFKQCDILHAADSFFAPFSVDLLVSNPPYVLESDKSNMDKRVLNFEPPEALFVPDHNPLLFYRAIAEKALIWLKPGGWLFYEIHELLAEETSQLIKNMGFTYVELKLDVNNKYRMLRARSSS